MIPAQRGLVLSLVVAPGPNATPQSFRAVVEAVTRIVEQTPDASRPLPGQELKMKWPPAGYDLEARASRKAGESIGARKAKVLAKTLLFFLIMHFKLRVGGFIPEKYVSELIANSDFRKFDDACAWCSIARRSWRTRSRSASKLRRPMAWCVSARTGRTQP